MKKIIAGLFAIAVFTFSANAQNQNNDDQKMGNGNGRGFHKGNDGAGMRGMEDLNLTDAQKLQMKSINEDFKTRMQSLNKNDNMTVKDAKTQREALMQERKNKISAILTPEQQTKFDQVSNKGGMRERGGEGRFDKGKGDRGDRGDRMEQMKTSLGLTDDQLAKMKAGNESFKQRSEAIRNNQSLSEDQKKMQMETLRKDKEASFKSYLTADQISKLSQMKGNRNGGDWKEKRKGENGKEKIKVKNT